MKRKLIIAQFWIIWAYKKCWGVKNYSFKYVRTLSFSIKAEHVRMWMAPNIEDKEFF